MSVLDDRTVRGFMLQAWEDSQPGSATAHEEGGFVLRAEDGSLSVERWPRGLTNQIVVPSHPDCKRGDVLIVGTFHTHPNPGPDYQQEPSLTDVRAVRDDPDLNHAEYEGEFVISTERVYRIQRNGKVQVVGETKIVLSAD